MIKGTESAATPPPLTRRQRKRAIAAWEAQRKRELEESLAVLDARRRAEKRQERRRRSVSYWPVWLGLLLGLLGPVILFVTESVGSWCTALVFPFVALAQRPEIQVGRITHLLPTMMLYLQFPIEGLLACLVLKRRVPPLRVVWQVTLFHFLGVTELIMLSDAPRLFLQH